MGAPPVAESSDLSEWPRSADDVAALSARNMPGTATGIFQERYPPEASFFFQRNRTVGDAGLYKR